MKDVKSRSSTLQGLLVHTMNKIFTILKALIPSSILAICSTHINLQYLFTLTKLREGFLTVEPSPLPILIHNIDIIDYNNILILKTSVKIRNLFEVHVI